MEAHEVLLFKICGICWSTSYGGAKKIEVFESISNKMALSWRGHKTFDFTIQTLTDSLDLIMKDWKLETIRICDELLKPKNIVMLLLVADILVPVNHFSMFLQKKILIYAHVSANFSNYLKELKSCKEMIEVSLKKMSSHF